MQFRDLKAQYAALKDEIDAGIAEVLDSASFVGGKQVELLEAELAHYVGVKHCISCANGTDALTLALMALDLKAGECAFVPDFTFFATGEVVSYAGAVPIFVDVEEDTFNMNPEKLKAAIEKVLKEGKWIPKVIITVDLFGLPADYKRIQEIADKYNLKIVEDGAQGFGGELDGKKACSFGDIGTTSFFPAKPLGCYGDGGAVFTEDDSVAAYIKSIKVHGKGINKYDNVRIGMNSRLDALQAAVLFPKFQAFKNYEKADINKAAARYCELLKDYVKVPKVPEGYVSSWAQYCIGLENKETRDGLQAYLKEQGIPTMIYYPKPLHKQEAFGEYHYKDSDYPVSEKLSQTILALPIHPYIGMYDIEKVAKTIISFLK